MSIRQDTAQLIISIDAKESVEYQKAVQRSAELTRNIKKMTVGSDEYNAALKEQAEISKRLGQTDYTKLSLKNLADRKKALMDQIRILPQAQAAELGLERELQRVNSALAENARRTRAVSQEMGGFNSILSSLSPTFANVSGGIGVVLTKIRALFATPIGWIIAIAAAVGAGAKEWYDYNTAILENRKITEDITGLTGKVAQDVRSQAIAISESTGLSITETLNAAKNAVNNFGVDYGTALDIISTGLIDAGNKQNLFLESVSEYSVFFGQAGFSFEEFSNIINSGIDLGIYQDKLPDAIKEFTISINEQTVASKAALENAFGKPFTEKLLGGVKDGSITVADALGQISSEASRVGLNSQQAAQLTADLFRGAGEDAGGALNIFMAVNEALSDEPRLLTDIQKAQIESIRLNTELEKSKARALETEGFLIFKQSFINTWKEVQIVWYNFLENVRIGISNFVDTVKIQVAVIKAAWLAIPGQLKIVKDGFMNSFREIGNAASALFDSLKNVFTLNFDAAAISFDKFKQAISNSGSSISNARKEANEFGRDAMRNADAAARAQIEADKKVLLEQAKLEKQAQDIIKKNPGNLGGSTSNTKSPKSKKSKTEKDKAGIYDFNFFDPAIAQKALDLRLKQLEDALAREQSMLEESFLQGKITEDEYNVQKLRNTADGLDTRIQLLDYYGQAESDKRRELNKELLKTDKDLIEARAKDIIGDGADITDLQEKFINQLISEEEFNLSKLNVERLFLEEKKRMLEEAGLTETETYKKLQEDLIKNQLDYNKQKEENEKRSAEIRKNIQAEAVAVQGDLLDVAVELLGRDEAARKKNASAIKAFESGKVLVNSISEIGSIWKGSTETLGPIAGPIFAAIRTIIVGARAGLAISKINAQQFYGSGRVKPYNLKGSQRINVSPNIPTQEGGDNVLAVVKPGEVVLNERHQQMAGGDSFFAGLGVPGFANSGIVRLPNTNPTGLTSSILGRNQTNQATAPQSDGRIEMLAGAVEMLARTMPAALANIKADVSYFGIKDKENEINEIRSLARV